MMSRSFLILSVAAASLLGWDVDAQVAIVAPDTTVAIADSSDLRSVARSAQARFERRRLYELPRTLDSHAGPCDENVGRFCTWYGEGEWYPTPENPQIIEMRTALLETLDSIQALLPGDGWVLGQRVWYRSEAGDWDGALRTARECAAAAAWWCAALEGYALHGLDRYSRSVAAFERALTLLDPARALEWKLPVRAVDSDARDLLEDLEDVPTDSLNRVLERLWSLADPLFLVDGNDRRSAHYARWTVAHIREDARNPFHIRWGRDLEELTVRHGWEIGWERASPVGSQTSDNVIGHKHPEGRDFMPPGRALSELSTVSPDDLQADRRRPRSLYAPAYAPVLLPMDNQLAVFPRGGTMVVVATHALPPDTTYHAEHGHEMPWMDPGSQGGMAEQAGLFLLSEEGRPPTVARSEGSAEGVLSVEAPVGTYLLSSEVWSPAKRRAGRVRVPLSVRRVPEDVAALSDLLMVRPLSTEPESLREAVPSALASTKIRPGQTFAVAWEVAGLGFRAETLTFELSVDRTDRNVFRRIGEFLGVTSRPQPLSLSWEEPGPGQPTHLFRYLNLDLPDLDEGQYEIRLILRTTGRSDVVSSRAFSVEDRD